MDAPRVVLLVFLLIFLFVSPDTQAPTLSQQYGLNHVISEEHRALQLLNASSYGDLDSAENRWINVTGLRHDDGYAWNLLPKVRERAREQVGAVLGSRRYLELNGRSLENAPERINRQTGGEDSRNPPHNTTLPLGSWNTPLPLFQNVTGMVRGQWVRSKTFNSAWPTNLNLSALAPQMIYATEEYNRNITGQGGNLRIKLDEKKSEILLSDQDSVREIRAEMTIKDEYSSGDGWELILHGVHYPQLGGILLTTTSETFAGIFALPHFALSEHTFSLAQRLLNRTLLATIMRQESSLYTAHPNPWASSPNNPSDILYPTPKCQYVVYLQQHPSDLEVAGLSMIEEELRFPTGASLPPVPTMSMSALIFSPDCGFVLESKGPPDYTPQQGMHLVGPKLEIYLWTAKRCISAFAIVICMQIFLLFRQMKDTCTPSTRSRVSFYAIAMMAMGDGFACMGIMVVGMFVDAVFLPLISTAFLAFLCVSFFGMKFLMDIHTVQAPERRERERRNPTTNTVPTSTAQNGPTPTATITVAGADTLPLPVTARRPTDTGATPVLLPPDQDIGAAAADDNAAAQPGAQTTLGSARREMGALYSRFYLLLLGILFLSLHATSWPTVMRSIYTNGLVFGYLSFWVPQIYRNIVRNCRKALRWEFVIGQSLLHLTPFVYLYMVTDNILFIDIDHHAAYVLMGWVWIQVWVLVSQEILGPRFFIPNGWAPPAYDYHPILREDDEEAGSTMPVGFTQATSDSPLSATTPGESTERGKKSFDCAICMQNIEVPVIPVGPNEGEVATSLATNIFGRRSYMVTPCRHIFHSACLEGWMRYRLQCPICRENLPPL